MSKGGLVFLRDFLEPEIVGLEVDLIGAVRKSPDRQIEVRSDFQFDQTLLGEFLQRADLPQTDLLDDTHDVPEAVRIESDTLRRLLFHVGIENGASFRLVLIFSDAHLRVPTRKEFWWLSTSEFSILRSEAIAKDDALTYYEVEEELLELLLLEELDELELDDGLLEDESEDELLDDTEELDCELDEEFEEEELLSSILRILKSLSFSEPGPGNCR